MADEVELTLPAEHAEALIALRKIVEGSDGLFSVEPIKREPDTVATRYVVLAFDEASYLLDIVIKCGSVPIALLILKRGEKLLKALAAWNVSRRVKIEIKGVAKIEGLARDVEKLVDKVQRSGENPTSKSDRRS